MEGKEKSNWDRLMQISESDKIILRALEDCRINFKQETIYFVSEFCPILPTLMRNKPYSQVIGSIGPRIASKYKRDESYRIKLDAFLQLLARQLSVEDYPGQRVASLLKLLNEYETNNNTTK